MFKLFVKLMLLLVVLALAGPFVLRGPDGRPFITLDDLKLPSFKLPQLEKSDPPAAATTDPQQWIQWADKVTGKTINPNVLTREQLALLKIEQQDNIFYRWQDANGVWQFSNLPNRNTLNHVVRTNPDANVLQSMAQEDIDRAFGRQVASQTGNSITENNPLASGKEMEKGLLPIPTTVPVTEIPKLLDQAKDVQRIMEQRLQKMDQQAK